MSATTETSVKEGLNLEKAPVELWWVDEATGDIFIRIHKSTGGPLGNQLIATPEERKNHRAMRRIGYLIKEATSFLYGSKSKDEVDELITKAVERCKESYEDDKGE